MQVPVVKGYGEKAMAMVKRVVVIYNVPCCTQEISNITKHASSETIPKQIKNIVKNNVVFFFMNFMSKPYCFLFVYVNNEYIFATLFDKYCDSL